MVAGLVFLMAAEAGAQEPSTQAPSGPSPMAPSSKLDIRREHDLTVLNLKIAGVEVSDHLVTRGSRGTGALRPKKGMKLVIVTLAGIVDEPSRIKVTTNSFEAVCEIEKSVNVYGKIVSETTVDVVQSVALLSGDSWLHAGPEEEGELEYIISTPGVIEIKAAFLLPEKVKHFLVRYPAVSGGVGVIPSSATGGEQK